MNAFINAVPVLCALGILAVLILLAYVAIYEARVQFRNWRLMHRNPRPGFIDVSRQDTRKRLP